MVHKSGSSSLSASIKAVGPVNKSLQSVRHVKMGLAEELRSDLESGGGGRRARTPVSSPLQQGQSHWPCVSVRIQRYKVKIAYKGKLF